MKIAQYNSHHGGIGSDGQLSPERFAKALVALQADVICLNEVEQRDGYGNSDQVATYLHTLGPDWMAHVVSVSGAPSPVSGQCNVILSKLPITGRGQKGLHGGRSAAFVVVANTVIYTTHVANDSANERNVQLCQQLVWHREQADPRVICGDFNCHAAAVELAPWLVWYKDAWAEAVKMQLATSFNGTGNTRNARIDYQFFRGLTVVHADVPDTRLNGVYPSDHSPVVVEYR